MKRILVPTDFSPTAERALRLAIDIADRSKGTIILYHAFKPVKKELVSTAADREKYNKQAEINLVKRLQRLKKKVDTDGRDVSVSTIVGRVPVVDNILGFAEHNHIDLIVMGTQGASGLRKTIVGSVASKVADHADVPVLLVPEKYVLNEPKNFLFASNYVASDRDALGWLLELAKLYGTGVTVIHLVSAYLPEVEKRKERSAFEAYSFTLQREFSEYTVKFELLETSSVVETMEHLEVRIPYDIVAMIRRNKSFYEKFFVGSFTKNMAYVKKRLLLIIPEEKAFETESGQKHATSGFLNAPYDNLQIEKIIKKNPAGK